MKKAKFKFKLGDDVMLIKIPKGVSLDGLKLGSTCIITQIGPATLSGYNIQIKSPKFSVWYCNEKDIVLAKDITNFEKIMYGIPE